MQTVNIHYAKTHLSRLIEEAAKGESFVIAKAGKPLVTVSAISAPAERAVKRIGFLEGQFEVPNNFDRLYEDEIAEMFEGE